MGWAKIDSSSQGRSLLRHDQINNAEHVAPVGTQNFSSQPFWQWVKKQGIPGWDIFNGHDNQLAQFWSNTQTIRWQSKANAGFTEVNASQPSFRFDIDTTQSLRFLSQQRNKNVFSGRFNFIEPKPYAISSDVLRAHSSSLTYFARPEGRQDGKEEQPNLFHPYWHARLVSR
jgi:hypothetical protein